jgi:hypothetical protein
MKTDLAFKGIETVATTIQAHDGQSLMVGDVFKNVISYQDLLAAAITYVAFHIL